jgi:hypothetical protein
MKNSQIKYMMRNPKSLMEHQMTGRLPSVRKPTRTPLWTLLDSMTPRQRIDIKGVVLSPKLGYQCNIQFGSAEQLFDYLGGHTEIVGNSRLPSEERIMAGFNKKLQISDLLGKTNKV